MATLKWKNNKYWETFFYGAFNRLKLYVKNIIKSINNAASAVRMRCRRDKNLSDIYDDSKGRINLELINDCSALSRASHHHDSRYIPMINDMVRNRKNGDDEIRSLINDLRGRISSFNECTCSSGGGGPEPGPTPTPNPNPKPNVPRFLCTIRLPDASRPSTDEHVHWIFHTEGVFNDVQNIRADFKCVMIGRGVTAININGTEHNYLWTEKPGYNLSIDGHRTTMSGIARSCSLGPFPARNNANNTFDFGLDGNNKIGIRISQASVDLWAI